MIPVFIHFYLVSCTHGRNDPDSLCLEIPFDSDSSVFIHSNMKQHGGAHEIAKKRVKTSVSTCFQSEELLFIFNIKNSQTYSAFIFMLENSHTVFIDYDNGAVWKKSYLVNKKKKILKKKSSYLPTVRKIGDEIGNITFFLGLRPSLINSWFRSIT